MIYTISEHNGRKKQEKHICTHIIHNIHAKHIKKKKCINVYQHLEIYMYCSMKKAILVRLVEFYGISTIVGYLMLNPVYTSISDIYMIYQRIL